MPGDGGAGRRLDGGPDLAGVLKLHDVPGELVGVPVPRARAQDLAVRGACGRVAVQA